MSASRPYTQRFLLAHGAEAWSTWAVPAAKRAIIVSMVSTWGVAGSSYVLWVAGAAVYRFVATGANDGRAVELRLAAYAGEILQIERSPEMYAVTLTGYIFDDTEGPIGRQLDTRAQINTERERPEAVPQT